MLSNSVCPWTTEPYEPKKKKKKSVWSRERFIAELCKENYQLMLPRPEFPEGFQRRVFKANQVRAAGCVFLLVG